MEKVEFRWIKTICCRVELKRLQQNYRSCRTEARERTDRLELFTRSDDVGDSDDVYLDLEADR